MRPRHSRLIGIHHFIWYEMVLCRGDKLICRFSVTVHAIPALILKQDLQTKQDFNNAVEMVS
jgi:hypothetical protein